MMSPYAVPFAFGKIGILIGGFVLLLVILALVVLAIVGIVMLARHSNGKKAEGPKSSVYHALAILDERYAKGEITDEEYDQKKAALKKE